MNPCKRGFFGDPKRECRCSSNDVQRYRDRISGPLLDRIEYVREIQQARFAKTPKVRGNARMTSQQLKRFRPPDTTAGGMLKMAMNELNFSARAYDRILRVARTIADLAGREQIEAEDVSEAIQYRTLDRNLWV